MSSTTLYNKLSETINMQRSEQVYKVQERLFQVAQVQDEAVVQVNQPEELHHVPRQ